MPWRDLESHDEPDQWTGLELNVGMEGKQRPSLHMQAGSRRMRLMAGESPILWARVASDHDGYWYLRRPIQGGAAGLLPPISAQEARTVEGPSESPKWYSSWSRAFGRSLLEAPVSPLHTGRWWLLPADSPKRRWRSPVIKPGQRPLSPVCHLDRLGEQPSAGYAEWEFSWVLEPLALRPMSAPEDARVKAWRRAFREGYMPPALLLWMSGLDRYVVIDGHDRIAAALAEGALPPVLVLCRMQERARIPEASTQAVAHEVARQLTEIRDVDPRPQNRPYRIEAANKVLIEAYDDRPHVAPLSRAWPLAGGVSRWSAEVSNALEGMDDDDLRWGLLDLE